MRVGFVELRMNETLRAVLFCLVIMPLAMTLYTWVDPSASIATRRHLTTLAPLVMAAYLAVQLRRPGETHLQQCALAAVIIFGVFALFAGQMSDDAVRRQAQALIEAYGQVAAREPQVPTSWTVTWRASVFGGHVLVLGLLVAWYIQRPGYSVAFCWALIIAAAAQTFNIFEYGLCNFRAPEISPSDMSRSVCVRQTGNPLYWLLPLVVVYGTMGQALVAWARK